LRDGLEGLDRLRAAGLVIGLDWEVERLRVLARELDADFGDEEEGVSASGNQDVLLRLALELNARGLTREGINLGWDIQGEGRPMDRHLLKAIYPFPYREIVLAEAREREADPFLMAGLIRQESAFWVEALSRADARGLMQVLPSTGASLARRDGPRGFDADEHLYRAEINIHLGTAFFVDMRRRFGEDLSIILSAYNAGPTRAQRWRQYPEAGDLPRFVERIPFTETRGYVKNVLRNREVYAWLYGAVP
jgi:soluble lytic murein transglycosylase